MTQNAPGDVPSHLQGNPVTVVVTTHTVAIKYFPIIGTGDSWQSPVPRANAMFSSGNQTLPVATSGDTQVLRFLCPLPKGFAYVLRTVTVLLWGADISEWKTANYAVFGHNILPFTDLFDLPMDGGNEQNVGIVANPGRLFSCRDVPEKTVIALDDDYCIQVDNMNTTIDGSAMSCRLVAELLQFDIQQAYSYSINTPISVR